LVGGGEHAVVILDAARLQGMWDVTGFVDPEPNVRLEGLGLAWLSDDRAAMAQLRGQHILLTVGGVEGVTIRRTLADRYSAAGCVWATVTHPSAVVASDATVGEGAAILARAVVNPGARVGEHSIINTGAIVEHDVDLGTNVQVGPGTVIGGGAAIGRDVFIGLGARIRDHVRIGAGAVIGMGSVVVGDVPAGLVVVGIPARPRAGKT
jgi:acetyltransferase EpsM